MKRSIYWVLGLFLILASCQDDEVDPEAQKRTDENLIQEYISNNSLNATPVGDGLYIVIEEMGESAKPTASDFVAVHYEGILLDGRKFDSSLDRRAISVFGLSVVIQGFRLGLQELGRGGKGKIIIPSHLAYGNNPPSSIPSNAVLVFDVELFEFGGTQSDVQLIADDLSIRTYLEEEGIEAESTSEGLYYTIEVEGTGVNPTETDQVTVDYEGFFLNGSKFDSSFDRGAPSQFTLDNVILGWRQGIPLLKEGGKGSLFIPSHLAYGGNPPANIPPFAILRFEVELLKVGP